MNNNELLGLLCEARNKIETHRKRWADLGAKEFEKDKKEKGEPIVVSFESEPSKEIKDLIKEAGLKWNRYRKEWNGFAKKEKLEKLLEKANTKIETLKK